MLLFWVKNMEFEFKSLKGQVLSIYSQDLVNLVDWLEICLGFVFFFLGKKEKHIIFLVKNTLLIKNVIFNWTKVKEKIAIYFGGVRLRRNVFGGHILLFPLGREAQPAFPSSSPFCGGIGPSTTAGSHLWLLKLFAGIGYFSTHTCQHLNQFLVVNFSLFGHFCQEKRRWGKSFRSPFCLCTAVWV